MNQTQVTTLTVPSRVHPTTAFMIPLSVHVTLLMHLLTGYELLRTVPYVKHYS